MKGEKYLMKIAVIGYSGAGKSTLAKQLGEYYGLPVLFLDCVQFTAGWQLRDREEALSLVDTFMKQDGWVIDGNYRQFFQARRLEEADRILFLNFSRFYCLLQAMRRYHHNKGKTRSDMADGCIEKMDAEFVKWILWDGRIRKRKKHYRWITQTYRDKTVVLKSRRQVRKFLAALQSKNT